MKGFRSPEPIRKRGSQPQNGSMQGNEGNGLQASTQTREYPYHRIAPFRSNPLPDKEIVINAAPIPGAPVEINWLTVLAAPVGMIIVMIIMRLVAGTSSSSYFMFMLPMSLISVIVAYLNYRSQKKKQRLTQEELEGKYLCYLNKVEKDLQNVVQMQQQIMDDENPPARKCATMNESSTALWNRSATSNRFMNVRLGIGEAPICVSVKAPEVDYLRESPLDDRARALADKYRIVSDIPVTLDLKNLPSAGITGDREAVVSQAISMIVSASALHSYEALKIVIVYPREEQEVWEDLRWLPHIFDEKRETRYIADNARDGKVLLTKVAEMVKERAETPFGGPWKNHAAEPHYLVVIADMNCIKGTNVAHHLTLNDPTISVSTLFLAEGISSLPMNCQSIIEVAGKNGKVYQTSASDKKLEFEPDTVSAARLSRYCRRMAPVRIDGATMTKEIPSTYSFFNAWKINAPEELQIVENWQKSLPSVSMSVPLGVGEGAEAIPFDAHRAVHGVHGIVLGGTGSGKSSMIRSWILSMATTFSPKFVNFVFIDFKGDSLLLDIDRLPHTVGTISSLDKDIGRNLEALRSEMQIREKKLEGFGGNIYTYYEKGFRDLSFLFVVVDELKMFRNWNKEHNSSLEDGMKLLDEIATVGNSLGIQLIAASQTLEPFSAILSGNAGFRWVLKMQLKSESIQAMGTDDAYKITQPGRVFAKNGPIPVFDELQSVYSDCPYLTPEQRFKGPEREMALLDLTGFKYKAMKKVDYTNGTQLSAVVNQICKVAEAIHQHAPRKIWPDQLPECLYLSDLDTSSVEPLTATVGLVDDPKGQQQYPLQINIVKNGHVVVYGAPQTGKSTFLVSAAVSLMLHCAPSLVEMYLVGSCFKPLFDCPQVEQGADMFSARPIITSVYNELQKRKKSGLKDEDRTILLFVDDIRDLMSDFRENFVDIAKSGPGCQVYLLVSAGKDADVHPIAAYVTRGYALWFSANQFDYKTALAVKEITKMPSKDIPGRAIYFNGRTLEFQTALPFKSDEEQQSILSKIHQKYKKIQKPPEVLEREIGSVSLGKSSNDCCEVEHNFRIVSYMLILGDKTSKRNRLLRQLGVQLSKQADISRIVGIDLDEDQIASIPGILALHSGMEVDTFFDEIFPEVKRRFELSEQKPEIEFPKIVLLVNDWMHCVGNISELSQKRFLNNFLKHGKRMGLQLVSCASYEEYSQGFEQDDIGATQVLGTGSAIFIDSEGKSIPECFQNKVKKMAEMSGDYYISSNSAEQLELLSEEELKNEK